MNKKIGIMGGTFDPIHIGHLILAETAYEQLDLDVIRFLPSGNPPHKRDRLGGGTEEQRLDMVSLAIKDNPNFELSLEDMVKDDYSFTYSLLERFKAQNPKEDLYFIIGADSLFDFEKWRNPERICQLCTLVVATRNQASNEELLNQINRLEELYHGHFIVLRSPDLDISSSNIRHSVKVNQSIRYYVPESVREYIIKHHMYKE